MKRGDLYRVHYISKNAPKDFRVFLVVSRQLLIEVGANEGLKHDSAIYCDDLQSLPKFLLTNYIGTLSDSKMEDVNTALRIALAVE